MKHISLTILMVVFCVLFQVQTNIAQTVDEKLKIYEELADAYYAVKHEPANPKKIQTYQMLLGKIPDSERLAKVDKFYQDYNVLIGKYTDSYSMPSTNIEESCDKLYFFHSYRVRLGYLLYLNIGLFTDENDKKKMEADSQKLDKDDDLVMAKRKEFKCLPTPYYSNPK